MQHHICIYTAGSLGGPSESDTARANYPWGQHLTDSNRWIFSATLFYLYYYFYVQFRHELINVPTYSLDYGNGNWMNTCVPILIPQQQFCSLNLIFRYWKSRGKPGSVQIELASPKISHYTISHTYPNAHNMLATSIKVGVHCFWPVLFLSSILMTYSRWQFVVTVYLQLLAISKKTRPSLPRSILTR